ncbi:MAG: SGNH/GDSL hydrolase family protein, partial [bacterium]
MLARLGLAAVAVTLVLGVAELGMRILGVGEVMSYAPDPRFGYLMRPSQVVSTYGQPIEINALGLRGPPVQAPKPAGVLRVLFLGDSITYGGGRVPEAALFCRRLEALARADGLRVESLNVSAPGWSPQNWTAWVEANGLFGADAVVVVIPAIDRARPFATLSANAMEERAPLFRLTSLWLKWRETLTQGPALTDDALAANLRALERLKAAVGARPLLAVFVPSQGEDGKPERWAPYQALYPDALDLRGAFGAADYVDPVHFSSAGHELIGRAVYARLRP